MITFEEIYKLWPELNWIEDKRLRDATAKTWSIAFEKSVLTIEDLDIIPFTLLAPTKISFIAHKRAVVHLSRECGLKFKEFFASELKVDMDVLISGAILADVGKLLEYEIIDGKAVQSSYGKFLRHPFSGVSLAEYCGLPAKVCHIIAAHAGEGDLIKRSVEAYIVHHSDFMAFLPFKDRLIE
jgi:putative nucleotidyltransferase with HDIG domain